MNSLELTRHEMRVKALQALFSLEYNNTISTEEAMIFALTYENEPAEDEEVMISIPAGLTEMVEGVCTHRLEIDQLIAPHLKKWTVNRLPKVDLSIMRIAIYEMMTDSVPAPVAINESIQLAKTFSDDKSRRFINGVLANVKDSIQG